MLIVQGVIVCAALIGLGFVLANSSAAYRRRRGYRRVLHNFQARPRLTLPWLPDGQSNASAEGVCWYLRGCLAMRAGCMRDAARAFGMAHHADCHLQTAALLTFAGLKSADGAENDFLMQLVQTWHEMKRPDVDREVEDNMVVEGLLAADPVGDGFSPLGRLAWMVSGEEQRGRLNELAAHPSDWCRPLFKNAN